jgi:hypothetical protein
MDESSFITISKGNEENFNHSRLSSHTRKTYDAGQVIPTNGGLDHSFSPLSPLNSQNGGMMLSPKEIKQ